MAPSVEETAEPLSTEILIWKQMTSIFHIKEVGGHQQPPTTVLLELRKSSRMLQTYKKDASWELLAT